MTWQCTCCEHEQEMDDVYDEGRYEERCRECGTEHWVDVEDRLEVVCARVKGDGS